MVASYFGKKKVVTRLFLHNERIKKKRITKKLGYKIKVQKKGRAQNVGMGGQSLKNTKGGEKSRSHEKMLHIYQKKALQFCGVFISPTLYIIYNKKRQKFTQKNREQKKSTRDVFVVPQHFFVYKKYNKKLMVATIFCRKKAQYKICNKNAQKTWSICTSI